MKRLLYLLLALCVAFAFALPCFAASDAVNDPSLPRVVDKADVLQPQEEAALEEEIRRLTDAYGFDILIYIEDSHGHSGSDEDNIYNEDRAYSSDIWDSIGYGAGADSSGWMIYVCMESRFFMDNSTGAAQYYHTYDTANIIEDYMYRYLSVGDFYNAFVAGLSNLDELFSVGPQKFAEKASAPDYDPDYNKPAGEEDIKAQTVKEGALYGGITGIVAGIINLFTAKSSMRTVRRAYDASDYEVSRSFSLNQAEDILLNVSVRREQKPDNDDRGGYSHSGGSSFTSGYYAGSGTSHTTSGRGF